jgi:hypothetical protein
MDGLPAPRWAARAVRLGALLEAGVGCPAAKWIPSKGGLAPELPMEPQAPA